MATLPTPLDDTLFRVRLNRSTKINGRYLLAGAEFDADAADAFEMVGAGRAALVDESDVARLARQIVKGQRLTLPE